MPVPTSTEFWNDSSNNIHTILISQVNDTGLLGVTKVKKILPMFRISCKVT